MGSWSFLEAETRLALVSRVVLETSGSRNPPYTVGITNKPPLLHILLHCIL